MHEAELVGEISGNRKVSVT